MGEEEKLKHIFEKLALDIYLYYKNTEEAYKEAIELSQKILELNPNNKYALMLKGFANFRLKNRKEAFEIYQKVLKLDEKNKVQDNLTQVLAQEFDISYNFIIKEQENIDNLENKLISNQFEDIFYKKLAVSYYLTKNFKESIKYYQIWLRKEPKDFESWFYLGEIYEEIEDWQKAIFCYEKATQIDPEHNRGIGIREGAKQKIKDLNKKAL